MSTDAWGIDSGYEDVHHVWRPIQRDTRSAILSAMAAHGSGLQAADQPSVLVVPEGASQALPGPGWLLLEDGAVLSVEMQAPADLPLGYHRYEPHSGDESSAIRIIVTPRTCRLPSRPVWAWAAQLYAARSAGSWGIGDLADLARLARWSAGLGAGLLLVNPLCAAAPTLPQQPSPYYPTSRRFHNPLYLCIEQVPGFGAAGGDVERLAAAGRSLNVPDRIDRDAVFRLKQHALERIWQDGSQPPAFDRYCAQQGFALDQFAAYCVLAERFGADWRTWPEQHRAAGTSTVARVLGEHRQRAGFHKWLQWLLDEQLARAAAELPLMQDLPIGVDPAGADAWAWQDILATGCTVGAPPDLYNALGQDWGLTPFVPHKLKAAGYEPFVQTIRAALRHARGLRIDHVMGLFRMYWIPASFGAARGAFVRYPVDDLLAIVALESHRSGAVVVGEDLGTVEKGVREKLARYGVLSYRLLWFEEQPPEQYPELAMVAVTTHDLPTAAGLWSGQDIADQERLGLAPNTESIRAIRRRVAAMAGLIETAPLDEAVLAMYRLLARSPSLIKSATLEDALAVRERPNMPGTTTEWPNWSIALPGGLEAIERSALAVAIAGALSQPAALGSGQAARQAPHRPHRQSSEVGEL